MILNHNLTEKILHELESFWALFIYAKKERTEHE